jgi:hypothetical protein
MYHDNADAQRGRAYSGGGASMNAPQPVQYGSPTIHGDDPSPKYRTILQLAKRTEKE